MALITRISRLFLADVNAILDQLEEPQALLKQAVREMEEEISDADNQLRELAQKLVTLDEQLAQVDDQRKATQAKVDLAMDANDADLARAMLRRRLTLDQQLEQLRKRRGERTSERNALADRLANWRERHETVTQKLAVVEKSCPPAQDWPAAAAISDRDVQVAYLAELSARQSS